MSVQPPLIDAATIADVNAAAADAQSAADQAGVDIAVACRQAAAAANEGRIDAARLSLEQVMPHTNEPRLLFLGFQFFFRTAVAESATLEERSAGLDAAEELVRRRLMIVEDRQDGIGASRAYTNLGLVLHYQHRFPEAEEHYRRAVDLSRAGADVRGLVRGLGNLGNFYETRHTPASDADLDAAEVLYREAIDAAEQAGLPHLAASPTANLGDLNLTRGDRAIAKLLWQQALSLAAGEDVKIRAYCERRLSETG